MQVVDECWIILFIAMAVEIALAFVRAISLWAAVSIGDT
jgi:hypothetical protein